jgi:hypothetical protein
VNSVKQKEQYTLEELFNHLAVTVTELSNLAGMSEVTIRRIRHGYPARRSTANKLLLAFSKAYDRDLSVDNVVGIVLDERQRDEKVEKPSASPPVVQPTEKVEKRVYNRKQKDSGLPTGAILATDFARNHGRNERSFRDDMVIGLGPGVPWGMGNEMTVEKEHVDYSERPKPSRPHEKERYLTSEQQKAAFEFWQRHNVSFEPCNDFACWCHTVKNGE